jgi:hypothetical protein
MALLAALFTIAAIAGGCGDDDEPTSAVERGGTDSPAATGAPHESNSSSQETGEAESDDDVSTTTLSKGEFIEQAGAACLRQRAEIQEKLSSYSEKHSDDDLAPAVLLANSLKAVAVPVVEAELAAIEKLGAPAGDEEEISAILAAERDAVVQARKMQKAKTIATFEKYFAEADRKLKKYGLDSCAKS